MDDARDRRLQEERDTDEYRAWAKALHAQPPDTTGPHCFRCGIEVDYRQTGDGMRPIEVMNRATGKPHRYECYGKAKR